MQRSPWLPNIFKLSLNTDENVPSAMSSVLFSPESFIPLLWVIPGVLSSSLDKKMFWKHVSGRRGPHLHFLPELERRPSHMGQKTAKWFQICASTMNPKFKESKKTGLMSPEAPSPRNRDPRKRGPSSVGLLLGRGMGNSSGRDLGPTCSEPTRCSSKPKPTSHPGRSPHLL